MAQSAKTAPPAEPLSRQGSLWFESAFCRGYNGEALLFSDPEEVLILTTLSGLKQYFQTLDQKLAQGHYLAGWLSYEAGYGFEPALFSSNYTRSPLAWFGVYKKPGLYSQSEVQQLFSATAPATPGPITFNLTPNQYEEKIRTIKAEIAAGNLYQVNFTGRSRFTYSGPPSALYAALRSTQPSSYSAFLNTGPHTILSFSPELFFAKRGPVIETMPMKGTAPRGRSDHEDLHLKDGLTRCQKNLAENLMIVDLLRNDLGRICKPGSIIAEKLFTIQTYPTLHQMVSTIKGEQRENISLYDLFKALYPSGSITGAPKIKAMKLIQTLEPEPRGIYTGTIGFITPAGDMLFNVAIRTIELSQGKAIYGTGSGIVWDSDPHDEYRECQLKTKILTETATPPVQLFESILWAGSFIWLQEHLSRLSTSARSLGYPFSHKEATLLLMQLEEELRQQSTTRFKVKLTLSPKGTFTLTRQPIEVQNPNIPARLCLATQKTDSSQPHLYHKTTARDLYDRSYTTARQNGYDEILFLNERDELTEGAISNLIISKNGHLYTPPLTSGLLNGIFRQYLLKTRPFAHQKTLTLQDLLTADTIYIANSVRGLRKAILPPPLSL